tara:strand:+ start:380 stop:1000 length:621 start_codon:yes stop_codon:yes gene_type:complete
MEIKPNYLIWGLVALLLILQSMVFFHEQLQYSKAKICLYMECRLYSLIYALVTFTFSMFLLISLTHIAAPPFLPTYWYIGFGIVALMIILLHHNQTNIISGDHKFSPPPEHFFGKKTRIVIRSLILALVILIFVVRYMAESQPTLTTQPFIERFIYNRFGGLQQGNIPFFYLSWLTILIVPFNIFRLVQEVTFHPTAYHLPLNWYR